MLPETTFQSDPTNPRGVKRKSYSTINAPLRKKVAKGNYAAPMPALITRSKAGELGTEEEADTVSHPSPPLLQPDELDEASHGRNFPSKHPDGPSDPNSGTIIPNQHSKYNSLSRSKEHGSIALPARKNAESDDEGKTIHPTHQRHLLGQIKLTISLDGMECGRKKLACEIFDVVSGKLQELNTLILPSVLNELESAFQDPDNPSHHEHSFDLWIRCLRAVFEYYEDTKSTKNLSTQPDLLKPRSLLSNGLQERRITENEFAKEVASVLFQLASWPTDVDLEELEKLTLEHTKQFFALSE